MVKRKILQALKIKMEKQKAVDTISKPNVKAVKTVNPWDNSSEITALSAGTGISITDTGIGMPVVSSTLTAGDTNTITINGTTELPTMDLTVLNTEEASYTNASITVDKFGRIIDASNGTGVEGVSSVTAGESGTIVVSNNPDTPVLDLAPTNVIAGDYTNPNFTVDKFGRITAAENSNLSFLQINNNLSDLSNKAVAITNLGLGQSMLSDSTNPPIKGYVPFSNNNTGTDFIKDYNGSCIYIDENNILNITGTAGIQINSSLNSTTTFNSSTTSFLSDEITFTGNLISYSGLALSGSSVNNNSVTLNVLSNISDSYDIYLPSNAPQDNQIMVSDSSGRLTWKDNTDEVGVETLTAGTTDTIILSGTDSSPIIDLNVIGTQGTFNNVTGITTDEFGRVTNTITGNAPITGIIAGSSNTMTVTGTTSVLLDLKSIGSDVTANYPSQILVDAYGRVTNVTQGTAPITKITGTPADIVISGSASTPQIGLNTTGVTAGNYPYATITVDAKGRITTASGNNSVVQDLTTYTSDITVTGTKTNPILGLATTGITAGQYSNPKITVDAKGRITAITNNSAPLIASNNLSDITSKSAAISNLGLNNSVNSLIGSADIGVSTTNGASTLSLLPTGVTAGQYTFPIINIDNNGRIISANSQSISVRNQVIFTTSTSSWVVPPEATILKVTLIGGGGGGGGDGDSNNHYCGGGGGSGGSTIALINVLNITNRATNITIGSGGVGNYRGTTSSFICTGSTTGVQLVIYANGGYSGLQSNNTPNGGIGAYTVSTPTNADVISFLSMPGTPGGMGCNLKGSLPWIGGNGGSSILGGGGPMGYGYTSSVNGSNAVPNTGSGGGGGPGGIGGTGAGGICIIEY